MSADTANTEGEIMEEQIEIANGVTLPTVELLTGRGFITGKSGSGKSNSASVVAEELLDRGFPILVVDTDGEYWGLKEQYEMLHVGADEEVDLRVGPEHADKLAELALEQNIPIILDVTGYLDSDVSDELVKEVAKAFFDREKTLNKPFLMLCEEVHEYIPEGGGLNEVGEMLIRVAKRGRKRGLGLIGISQRPADVKKDFITQCDWLVWHRLTWDNDTSVVRRVMDADAAETVQGLGDGESLLMTDWDGEIRRVQWRRKETFDAGATPGLDGFDRPDLKSVSDDLLGELEDISDREERRRGRIAELESTIGAKEDRISELEEERDRAQDMSNMAEQFTSALTASGGDSSGLDEKIEELREEKDTTIRELKKDKEEMVAELEGVRDDREKLREQVAKLKEYRQAAEHMDEVREAVERMNDALGIEAGGDDDLREKLKRKNERIEELESESAEKPDPPDVIEHPAVQRQLSSLKDEISSLDEKQRAMLEWYKFYGPGSPKDAYFHAGGSRNSSHVSKKNKTLRDKELVEQESRGEYRYRLDEKVCDQFGENPQIGEQELDALVAEVESEIDA